ncbi:hypothetical protein UlMin_000723 [Ulmus minor]
MDSLLKEYMARNDAVIQSQAASLRNLENQKNLQQNRPPPPFPQRFKKQHQDQQFRRFLDVLKQLHINIPLVEALEQMPNYVKFMKDMLTKKMQFGEFETVALTREYSAVLQNKLPPKLKDPGSFTIPCSIGNQYFGKALCDLGVSINLMPMSIFKKLGIGEARPTTVPIILGRPFLATRRTLIDVQKGELTMRVQDEQVTFNVFQATKFPSDVEECSAISLANSLVAEQFERCCKNSLQFYVYDGSNLEDEIEEEWAWVETKQGVGKQKLQFEPLDMSSREFKLPKSSVDEPPVLEMKPLPSHLRYAYLDDSSTLPVIISASLTKEQEAQLLEVLKKFKKAIGWTLADIKGISPSFCLHKILLEDNEKGSIEAQRRLNPIMKEVVKKKIIKWPDKTKAWHDKRIYPRNFEVG